MATTIIINGVTLDLSQYVEWVQSPTYPQGLTGPMVVRLKRLPTPRDLPGGGDR